uniref:Uncharacterized protein n=1 Tax=Solanum lycopersicum TaxID=4081 RepID=A0A494G8V1_SOLLC
MACHNVLLKTHTTIQHLVSHAIFALRLHARSNDLGLGMPTWTLGSIYCRTTSGVTCYIALGQHTRTYSRSTSGVTYNHRPWTAATITHTIGLRRAWHAIMVLGQHTQSEGGEHDMPSSPLDNKHGSTILNMV